MSGEPIRVVLVDDDPLVRAGLSLMLRGAPQLEIVGEAGDGVQALEVIARTRPDVVLMDIRMPRLDGLAATQRLSEQADAPAVIVLTTFDADEYVVRALANGATGFLLKDTSPADDRRGDPEGRRRRADAVAQRHDAAHPQSGPRPRPPARTPHARARRRRDWRT